MYLWLNIEIVYGCKQLTAKCWCP